MKEAWFYNQITNNNVECFLCPHNCKIKPGKRGLCGVRENIEGKLYSLVYGKVIAEHIDPVEKKPIYHILPGSLSYSIGTAGCNLSCRNCQNWQISQSGKKFPIQGNDTTPEEIVKNAIESGCKSIAYTYTEPTIFYEFAYDCAALAKSKGLKNIFVTNGYINSEPLQKIAHLLDACNVDLKSFREETYRKICGGKLEPVKNSIKLMKKLGIWVEITTLLIPKANDSFEEIADIAGFIKGLGEETPWHISAFWPNYLMTEIPPTPVSLLNKARNIGIDKGLKYVYTGNLPTDEGENTYCYNCKNLLIERQGFSIIKNTVKNNKCPHCNVKIDGIFQ
ncbi:MAG: AmmeMemoRadiSam system radical SAM enzyme [Candidatus Ratteibacteria bacterium]|nr:AmmeMemoRadiSam system radical SAM enzyme [Candidatus Ratteibacteria bacterium]